MKSKFTKSLLAMALSCAMCITPLSANAASTSIGMIPSGSASSGGGSGSSAGASSSASSRYTGENLSSISAGLSGSNSSSGSISAGTKIAETFSFGSTSYSYYGASSAKKAVMCTKHGGKTHVYGYYTGSARAQSGDKLKVYGIKVNGKYYKINKNGYCNTSYDSVYGKVDSKFNGKVGKISYICLANMYTQMTEDGISFSVATDLTVKAPALSKNNKADVSIVLNKYSDTNPKGTVISMKLTNVGVSDCKTSTSYTKAASTHTVIKKCRYSGKVTSSKKAKHSYKNKKCTVCGKKK